MPRTAIIGGGISGLAAALRIAELRHEVVLLESESRLGGLGGWFTWRGVDLERFYHCILPGDRALRGLIEELGLERNLMWRRVRMGFMYRRRVYPMDGPLDLMRFAPLPLIDRVRMGLLGIRARRHGMDAALDDVTVGAWLRQHVGERAFNLVWRPLLQAKVGDGYRDMPALWLSSRMSREKNTGPEVKGCLTGGYRSLIDACERRLRERGADIRFRARVVAIEDGGEQLVLRLQDGSVEGFDTVVSTLPLPRFQQVVAGLGLDERLTSLDLDYQGVVTGVFLLERPLSAYYWMPIVDSDATAQGVIEMSNLVPLDRAHGLYVVYLVNYAHRDSRLYQASDEEIVNRYTDDLTALFPRAAGFVVDRFVFRAPFVEPLWTLRFGQRRPSATVLPGRLYMACTAQVYPRVNSWNSCCEVVEEMMAGFSADVSLPRTSARPASRGTGVAAGEVKVNVV
jgi:protoporphyrinogen oxidase